MSLSAEPRDLLLVDDHPIILVAVKALIESKMPGYRLHCAQTRADAIATAERIRPKLAVIDIMLPDGDGLDLIRKLKELSPGCSVLVFSMQSELRYGPRALKAGASGYLMKGDRVSALLEAIQMIEAASANGWKAGSGRSIFPMATASRSTIRAARSACAATSTRCSAAAAW